DPDAAPGVDAAVAEGESGELPDRPGGHRLAGPRADAGPAPAPPVAPGQAAVLSLGFHRDGPLHPADLPAAGVGLTGPDAGDPARRLVPAAASTGRGSCRP